MPNSFDAMTNSFISMIHQKQEEVLLNILRQILKREPTIEDAKDVTIGYPQGKPDIYYLAYKGTTIGTVKTVLDGTRGTVTFTPSEQFR